MLRVEVDAFAFQAGITVVLAVRVSIEKVLGEDEPAKKSCFQNKGFRHRLGRTNATIPSNGVCYRDLKSNKSRL